MRRNRWFVAIFFAYLILFFAHALYLQKTVYGDGIFYYSWVRSIVVDRDVQFANEYAHFGVTARGNKHPIGAALLWLPWYAQTHTVLRGKGYELPYQLVVGLVSVLAALTGLVLTHRLLTQRFGQTASLLAVVSLAGATNLLFYGAIDPVNSHAVSFFATAIFLSFLKGAPLGFSALVRPQDALLGFIALPKLSFRFFLGAIFVFLPQLLLWYALYGKIVSPYLIGGESFNWWPAHFFDVLFSPTNGLFLWTPITVLAVIGLLFWKNPLRAWFFGVFVAEVAIVASWSIWWQGASYSGRMLVSTLPLLSFGLAALYTRLNALGLRWKSMGIAIIAPLTILNVLFIVRFLLQA